MDTTTTQTDRIEKTVVLNAPRSKVWQAISVAEKFGAWFGVRLDGPFKPGTPISGRLTYPKYEHLTMTLEVERIEPEHYFLVPMASVRDRREGGLLLRADDAGRVSPRGGQERPRSSPSSSPASIACRWRGARKRSA